MKRAQSLALNTIVVAAIVLIVLIVIIGILMSSSGKVVPFFGKQTECTGRGGTCELVCGDTKIYGLGCEKDKDGKDTGKVCCIKGQT